MKKNEVTALVAKKQLVNEAPLTEDAKDFEIPLTCSQGGVKAIKNDGKPDTYEDNREFASFSNGEELGAFLVDFYRKKYDLARGRTHVMDANKGLQKITNKVTALYFADGENPKKLMKGSNTLVLPSLPKFVNGKQVTFNNEQRAMTAELHKEICVTKCNAIWNDVKAKFGVIPTNDAIFTADLED